VTPPDLDIPRPSPRARARTDPRTASPARRSAQLWRAYETARRRIATAEVAAGRTLTDPTRTPSVHDAELAQSPAPRDASRARWRSARNALVEHYQPLVRTILSAWMRRLPRCVDRGDLETAANVGLMAAIEGFDRARGVPFELYAEHRLRGALLDELRNQDWLPRPWRARLEARRRTIEKLTAEFGREPWDDEVATALGIPLQAYLQDYGVALGDGPVSESWGEDASGPGGAVLDGVPDAQREPPEDRLTRDDLLRLVAQKLTVQEYRLVYLKYWEEMPLREIGTVLGLSESRVCKIHLALLDRLRDKLGS
jgi:RNA polymerase sigma factor for flagellar operon FliA